MRAQGFLLYVSFKEVDGVRGSCWGLSYGLGPAERARSGSKLSELSLVRSCTPSACAKAVQGCCKGLLVLYVLIVILILIIFSLSERRGGGGGIISPFAVSGVYNRATLRLLI